MCILWVYVYKEGYEKPTNTIDNGYVQQNAVKTREFIYCDTGVPQFKQYTTVA